jgi:RNA polymerase sigma factor (sigma-70 family)
MLHHHDRNYLAALTQERLVAAASAGDEAAWGALGARFDKHLRWVARRHGLGADDAEDVAQETMLRLFTNIARIRDHRAVAGWLRTTARRESMRTIKTGQRERTTDVDLCADVATCDEPLARLEAAERAAALARAMERLPDRHRRLMTALFAEPAPTYAELSARFGIPVGSIGPIRARCLERLRRDDALAGLE